MHKICIYVVNIKYLFLSNFNAIFVTFLVLCLSQKKTCLSECFALQLIIIIIDNNFII